MGGYGVDANLHLLRHRDSLAPKSAGGGLVGIRPGKQPLGLKPCSFVADGCRDFWGELTDSPKQREVLRGVVVGVLGVSAVQTAKFSLILAVGLFAVAADRTHPAAVARVHQQDRNTLPTRLVLDECPQLKETPVAKAAAEALANR